MSTITYLNGRKFTIISNLHGEFQDLVHIFEIDSYLMYFINCIA